MNGAALFAFMLAWSCLDAVIIRDLWAWFAVPSLGAPPIGVLQAYGLNLLACCIVARPRVPAASRAQGIQAYLSMIASCLAAWGIGYAVSHWLM